MKPRHSFSSKHTRRARDPRNIRKQKSKFPEIAQIVLDTSDIILQVLDARFIEETRNIELEKFIKGNKKNIIYVINKSDLTDKFKIKSNINPKAIVSCKNHKGIKNLRNKIKVLSKSINKPKVVVGVLGYPNVGKSSIINLLIEKKSAPASAQAGFTKGLQKVRLSRGILLIDSPGVISKEDYSTNRMDKLAKHAKISSRTYSQVKNPEQIVHELFKEYKEIFQKYFKIKTKSSEYLIEKLGRQKNFLKKGNLVNEDKTARKILKDWQEGRIRI